MNVTLKQVKQFIKEANQNEMLEILGAVEETFQDGQSISANLFEKQDEEAYEKLADQMDDICSAFELTFC